ncbi:MAG: AraC family transcriptional regulator [Dorea sp.]|jgi:AraC-like DNA-binding protein|nr:AraC family transcriptional regulator [Dorea sp.]
MGYNGIQLKNSISIGKVYSIHYFEYMSTFSFKGESHDFWEFICVDKGDVSITAGLRTIDLKKGEIAFHEPNEFHNVRATGDTAPNLVVVSFECNSRAMHFFRQKVLKVDDAERNLLAKIIAEARHCFDCRLDDPYLQNMPQKKEEAFGSEQLIRLYLEQFLIHLARRYESKGKTAFAAVSSNTKATKARSDLDIYSRVTEYMETHPDSKLTIEQICRDNLVSRSHLQKIFKQQCNLGIIEYFSHMKIRLAKEMIRTQHMNFTQISEALGYASIHYFSRQFKKITGMTPSEYASSIKAMSEQDFKES